MDVFLMVRRQKTHLFCDAKENNRVLDVKMIIEGILKFPPGDQELYRLEDERDLSKAKLLQDDALLSDVGLTHNVARAQQPAVLGLAVRGADGRIESLEVTKVSDPPELPDVMKSSQSEGGQQSDPQTIS